MSRIDWGVIRRKGEEGLLTGDETDALVALAKWFYPGTNFCPICDNRIAWNGDEHKPTCPIAILEAASEEGE